MTSRGILGGMVFWICTMAGVFTALADLPDTGQTSCYDETGNAITCPTVGQTLHGQDANYSISLPSYTKLDVNGTELDAGATSWAMVRDNVTGLIWEAKTDDGTIHDRDMTYSWINASDVFIDDLNSTAFGGQTGWRLPTREELRSIADYGVMAPALNLDYFPNTQSDPNTLKYYWTSDEVPSTDNAWAINFYAGNDDPIAKINVADRYVRAVRGTATPPNYTDNGDGTVTDSRTGLMWQKDGIASGPKTWSQALEYCESLTLAGYDDWRLPNIKELASIVDLTVSDDADYSEFIVSSTDLSYYWTSTTYLPSPNEAWRIRFTSGTDSNRGKTPDDYNVRAVRGGQVMGDLNNDHLVDLTDAMIALKICANLDESGFSITYTSSEVSVNNDALISLEEAVYALQKTAGLRP